MASTASRKKKQPASRSTRGGKKAAQRSTAPELTGLALICLAIVSLVVMLTTDDPSNAVRSLLEGLGGHLSFVLPFIMLWVGIMTAFSATRPRSPGRVVMVCACFLLGFAIVHIFYAEQIFSRLILHTGWLNFLEQSFFDRTGAGAIGAILSYPVYRVVGQWGGAIMLVFMLLGLIVLLAHISLTQVGQTVQQHIQTGYADFREHYSEWADQRERAAQERRAQQQARDPLAEERRAQQSWVSWDAPAFAAQPQGKGAGRGSRRAAVEPSQPIHAIEPIAPMDAEPSAYTPPMDTVLEVPEYLKADKPAAPKRALGEDSPFPQKASKLVDFAPKARPEPRPEAQPTVQAEDNLAEAVDIPAFQAPNSSTELGPFADDEYEDVVSADPLDATPEELYPGFVTGEEDKPPFDLEDAAPRKSRRDSAAQAAEKAAVPAGQEDVTYTASTPAQPPSRLDRTPLVIPKKPNENVPETTFEYNYPPVDLLSLPKQQMEADRETRDREKAAKLEETLKNFGINVRLTGIAHGPAVTRFELAPAPGVKVSRITSLADDIALSLEALSIRIEAPIPGKAAVGVEIPNKTVETVPLREVLESKEARTHSSRLAVALGKDNSGGYVVGDIAKMPHVLIAGATGSGKSVCINCIISSILYRATPDEVRLIMIDPKVVELSIYNGIPHLLVPVVTDPKKASGALQWAVAEMTDRYKKFAERGVRDIKGYNKSCGPDEKPMPQIVIIIDELADLMMVSPGEVEDSICRLAQLARAAGIHLVIATQRPSVNVITGVIKANIPARIAFTVASFVDSRTILDVGGAEKLLGRGDMLFAPSGSNKMQRVQGAWISDEEVQEIVDYIKERHDVEYSEDVLEHMNKTGDAHEAEEESETGESDELLPEAIRLAVESGQASISMLQRRMRIGYARAGRLVDEMAARGIISQAEGAKPRTVLITREQLRDMFPGDAD